MSNVMENLRSRKLPIHCTYMKITVIGHICFDVIQLPNGTTSQSYGGIFFSIAALANLLNKNDTIIPVFGIGKIDHDNILNHLSKYSNIDTSAIFKFDGPTNKVHLCYSDNKKRIECSEHISEPISWSKIRRYLDGDMVFINMISGFDITLETLDFIRMRTRESKTEIYLDVHSLTLGIDSSNKRYYHPVDSWRHWLFMLHTVQMNETEAEHLTPELLNEKNLVKHILALNTKAVHITKGSRGSTVYLSQQKSISRTDVPAHEPEKAIDPTGCGDVYGAAYCAYYMKTKDILKSTEFANRVASHNAQLIGSSEIDTLSKFQINV